MEKITIGIKEQDKLIESLNFAPILESQKRQVRWLYKNSNKLTMVYEEKLVRIMIHRLQEKIKQLESNI